MGTKHTPDALAGALERFANAPPCPVFTAALDALTKGAPGLSERSCEALARSVAIKVTHGPYGKSRAGLLNDGWSLAVAALQSERYAREPDFRDAVDALLDTCRTARGEPTRAEVEAKAEGQP